MASAQRPNNVLMVGSVPLESPEDVFLKLSVSLPGRLLAIPDGETGDRWNYIGWQLHRFPPETRRKELGGTEMPEQKPTYTIESVQPTEYDKAAISSYTKLVQLRNEGRVPPDLRFQIGLPTPFNSIIGHIKPELQAELEPLYEQRFFDSLDAIAQQIPHNDMVIQWDLCFDMIALEVESGSCDNSRFKPYFEPIREGLLQRLERVCDRVPRDISLAFHLCYGDLRHKHFVEPSDLGIAVEFANAILGRVGKLHTIEWLHVPVPRGRVDHAYFSPLKALSLRQETRLVLGLVHANDEEGTRERIRAAESACTDFGVATECGLGRTPADEIESILGILKAVTSPPERAASL